MGKARFKGRTRHPAAYVRIYANKRKVIERLSRSGYCDQAGESKPNWVVALQPPPSFSVSRVASIIRGLDNYYKVADDRRQFTHRIVYILRSSLAKTFAAKFKLRTQTQVYSRAGLDLSRPLKPLTPIGKTDEQAKTYALKAGGKIIGKMPKLPFARGDSIPPPDKSHSYSGQISGVVKDPLQA